MEDKEKSMNLLLYLMVEKGNDGAVHGAEGEVVEALTIVAVEGECDPAAGEKGANAHQVEHPTSPSAPCTAPSFPSSPLDGAGGEAGETLPVVAVEGEKEIVGESSLIVTLDNPGNNNSVAIIELAVCSNNEDRMDKNAMNQIISVDAMVEYESNYFLHEEIEKVVMKEVKAKEIKESFCGDATTVMNEEKEE
ncbi:Hypothetical predicted protein [Olea europaea subsp. europaea]|uniref:Uncharacterized protein n=1 Tax=Olea europaea subsp. europaea TaxID=158383 RepID=A0A8S0SS18_OLEEU|nr:Hypothetical predicted protein [Olea europaea subsp. europaea]